MIRNLSSFIFALSALTLFCSMVPEKPGDTWWYVHGEPYYWHYQPDVFAFRSIDGTKWGETIDTNCVEFLFHRGMHHDKMNIIYFKPTCTGSEKEEVKETIRSSGGFQAEFPVITLYPDLSYASAAWFVIDDQLLVNFDPDTLTEKKYYKFKEEYNLKQINFSNSDFPQGISTFIFEFDVNEIKPGSAIDLARTIYAQDSGLVKNVQPNLINAYEKVSDENNDVLSSNSNLKDHMEYHLINKDNRSVKLFVKYKGYVPTTIIKIYDLFGRELNSMKSNAKEIKQEFDISDYVGGIYFASIENERGKVMGVWKFVKL